LAPGASRPVLGTILVEHCSAANVFQGRLGDGVNEGLGRARLQIQVLCFTPCHAGDFFEGALRLGVFIQIEGEHLDLLVAEFGTFGSVVGRKDAPRRIAVRTSVAAATPGSAHLQVV